MSEMPLFDKSRPPKPVRTPAGKVVKRAIKAFIAKAMAYASSVKDWRVP